MNNDNFAIIMAGGVGSRFWPVSTAQHPKQFRDLLGVGETLIQTTFRRLSALVPPQNIYVLTNEKYEHLVREQIGLIQDEQIVLEPVMRNTAPAVLLAALKIKKRNSKAVMIMAPSDHWIENEAAFKLDIDQAFEAARGKDRIITLGIQPTFPNTGYGYIKYNSSGGGIEKVKKFTEKPSYAVAKEFLKEGNYLWNAGIFVWNVDFIVRSFNQNLPDMYYLLNANPSALNSPEERKFIQEAYPETQDISIDYGILEKEEKTIYVIPATFDWNDLGTWGSLYAQSQKDDLGNALLNVRLLSDDSSGNILSSDSGKVVVVDGLKDYIIVDEKEVLLIVPKEKEQEIKKIRERVQERFGKNLG